MLHFNFIKTPVMLNGVKHLSHRSRKNIPTPQGFGHGLLTIEKKSTNFH